MRSAAAAEELTVTPSATVTETGSLKAAAFAIAHATTLATAGADGRDEAGAGVDGIVSAGRLRGGGDGQR